MEQEQEVKGRDIRAWRVGSGYNRDRVATACGVTIDIERNWERELSAIPPKHWKTLNRLMGGEWVDSQRPIDLTTVPEVQLIEELRARATARANATGER